MLEPLSSQPDPTAPKRLGRWVAMGLIVVLLAAWSGHLFLLSPWLQARASVYAAPAEQISQLLILGALPLLWVWGLDPQTTWHDVVHPLPGRRRPLHHLIAWAAIVLYGLIAWAGQGMADPSQNPALGKLWLQPPIAAALIMVHLASVAALEETLFRGYLLGRLSLHFGAVPGMLGQALAFTALHSLGWATVWQSPAPQLLAWSLEAFAFALVSGSVVRLQGGLLAAMGLHFVVNALRWSGG